jgi:hypothetical protein
VGKAALGHAFSAYFDFHRQSFHRLSHTHHLPGYAETFCGVCKIKRNTQYRHEREGTVTYKRVSFGLGTGYIVHLQLSTLVITIGRGAIANSQLQSTVCTAIAMSQLRSTVHYDTQ